MNDNDSSDMDLSIEWNEKVEQFLKATNEEIQKGAEREQLARTKKNAAQTAKYNATKYNKSIVNTAKEIDDNNQYLEDWIKLYTNEVNEITKNEVQSIETLKQRQQEIFQELLAEKNDQWEKEVLQRREEANQLKDMISHLNSLISIAKNEAKTDIEEAQKNAAMKAEAIRKARRRETQKIAELTAEIEKENASFELAVKQANQTNSNATQQKKDQLNRLRSVVTQLRSKLQEKEKQNDLQFRQQVKIIKDLRAQLQQARNAEKANMEELQKLKKTRLLLSRKISAQQDESISIQHQLALCIDDNEELQSDIMKLQNRMFPQIFNQKNA